MRAGYLSVFDGLRLTTEHFEHLQKAIHLALRDLRFIVGLGKVYSGFTVEWADEKSVLVRPGLAFDFQSNQIINDNPTPVEVIFGPEQEALYVCIQYDQVSTDSVEGRPSLIWDSCRIAVRSDIPAPADSQIAIARLEKQQEAAPRRFNIIDLVDRNGNQFDGTSGSGGPAPKPTFHPISSRAAAPELPRGLRSDSLPAIGTIKLSGELDTTTLQAKVQEILTKSPVDPVAPILEHVVVVLGEPVLKVPFPLVGITLHLLVAAEFVLPGFALADRDRANAEGPAATEKFSVCINAHTEATHTDAVKQWSMSSTQISEPNFAERKSVSTAEVDEAGIVKFRLGELRKVKESTISDILDHLVIRIALQSGNDSLLRLTCLLVWDREPSPFEVEPSKIKDFSVTWSIHALWKAIKL